MRIAECLHGLKIIDTNIPPECEFYGLTSNSRVADRTTPFIALRGEREDGHEYIRDAERRGAAVICSRLPVNYHGRYIIVNDTRHADAVIHANLHGNPQNRLKIIGVTGTNGKTSVCHMIKSIFEMAGERCAVIGTVENYIGGKSYPAEMTTPMPCDLYGLMEMAVSSGDKWLIMEVSSHGLCYKKLDPIVFDLSVFTNLTPDHLDFHKSMEEYADTKSRLFENSVISLINGDDPNSSVMLNKADCMKYTYGLGIANDFRATDVNAESVFGIEYILSCSSSAMRINAATPGRFNVYNTLAAASASQLLGVECRDIINGIASLRSVKGRLERIATGDGRQIFIDYAHTPDALENLLKTVVSFSEGREITLVFGCGGNRDKSKRPMMGRIASLYADRVVLTDDNPRGENRTDIINDILTGIEDKNKVYVVEDRACAIEYAIENLSVNGVLIVAGKGHEEYLITEKGKIPFDERKIIRSCLDKSAKTNLTE